MTLTLAPGEHQPGQRSGADRGQAEFNRHAQPALIAGVFQQRRDTGQQHQHADLDRHITAGEPLFDVFDAALDEIRLNRRGRRPFLWLALYGGRLGAGGKRPGRLFRQRWQRRRVDRRCRRDRCWRLLIVERWLGRWGCGARCRFALGKRLRGRFGLHCIARGMCGGFQRGYPALQRCHLYQGHHQQHRHHQHHGQQHQSPKHQRVVHLPSLSPWGCRTTLATRDGNAREL
ncbi:hypothetical protein D3C71_1453450 [compost metagenome]